MKKFWIWQGISGRYIGKVNKKWNQRLDKEELSDNDVMQLMEAMARYIAKKTNTPTWEFTVIKTVWWKQTMWYKLYDESESTNSQSD